MRYSRRYHVRRVKRAAGVLGFLAMLAALVASVFALVLTFDKYEAELLQRERIRQATETILT